MPKTDRRILWWIILAAVVAGSLPYVIGLLMKPAGYSLLGISPLAAGDTSVYYSYIEQGRHGHWLMSDVFTGEPYATSIWQPVWWLVGQLANIFHLSTPWAYAFARIAATPALIGAVWWLTGWLWTQVRRRIWATVVAMLGSGLGGLLAVFWPQWVDRFGFGSIDQWVSEAFVNLTLIGSVHFILVTAGAIVALVSLERSWEEKTWKRMRWACLAALGMVTIHPFHVVTWMVLAALMTVWHWINQCRFPAGYVARWAVLGLVVCPIALLYALQLKFDPLTLARALQNVTRSTSPLRTLLGLGLFFPLGAWGAWRLSRKNNRWFFVLAWGVATLIAMYLPLTFQRRLSQGLIIPWALLSIEPLAILWAALRRQTPVVRFSLAAVGILLLGWSWPMTVRQYVRAYQGQIAGRPGHTYFWSADQQAATQFIRTATNPNQILIASLHDSNILAGLTAHHVLVGHEVETINYSQKIADLNRIFAGPTDAIRQQIMARQRVCYVFKGPQELAIGPNLSPESWSELQPIWTSPTVTVYRTNTCPS